MTVPLQHESHCARDRSQDQLKNVLRAFSPSSFNMMESCLRCR